MDSLSLFAVVGSAIAGILSVLALLMSWRSARKSLEARDTSVEFRHREELGDPFERAIRTLKSKGVDDPDVDLFLGIIDNDLELVKQAIARGANVNTTTGAVLSKHSDALVTS